MILSTHAIIGGAIGQTIPDSPLLALLFGFISHFLLDAIPHWDYRLESLDRNESKPLATTIRLDRSLCRDLVRLGIDTGGGLIIVWLSAGAPPFFIFSDFWLAVLAGAAGALLPDLLQFVYFRSPREPFRSLQRFHHFIHTRYHFNNRPGLGASLQIGLVAITLGVSWLIR